jgi:hypothetical protein
VFKNSAAKATEVVSTARQTAAGLWGSFVSPRTTSTSGATTTTTTSTTTTTTMTTTTTTDETRALPPPPAAPVSPGWARWAPAAYAVGGALLAGAAAGTAYAHRKELGAGYDNVTGHMRYAGVLWDAEALRARLDAVVRSGVPFRTCVFRLFLPLISSPYSTLYCPA